MSVEQLTRVVRKYQDSTGEQELLVVLEDEDEKAVGVHQVGWNAEMGMLVDGEPATMAFCDSLDDLSIRPLQEPPRLLH